MEKIFKEEMQMWALDTDGGHILHRKGHDEWPEIRHIHARNPDDWEEVALEDVPKYSKAEYAAEVERLIARRYSHGKEIEVNRERESKPDNFNEYMAYVEECKELAREKLGREYMNVRLL